MRILGVAILVLTLIETIPALAGGKSGEGWGTQSERVAAAPAPAEQETVAVAAPAADRTVASEQDFANWSRNGVRVYLKGTTTPDWSGAVKYYDTED